MSRQASAALVRPERLPVTPVPPLPQVDESNAELASTTYSHYRTGLSNQRTRLSEHRTTLSEYRTDLSTERTEMSMRRTGMSFQRTRLSADRTLMSVIRTALSLISFGFTIFQVFQKFKEQGLLTGGYAARNFGTILVGLGIFVLVIGIIYHIQFMLGLRAERKALVTDGLIHGQTRFPPSFTLLTAIVLLLLGIFAIFSMVYHVGPLG